MHAINIRTHIKVKQSAYPLIKLHLTSTCITFAVTLPYHSSKMYSVDSFIVLYEGEVQYTSSYFVRTLSKFLTRLLSTIDSLSCALLNFERRAISHTIILDHIQ